MNNRDKELQRQLAESSAKYGSSINIVRDAKGNMIGSTVAGSTVDKYIRNNVPVYATETPGQFTAIPQVSVELDKKTGRITVKAPKTIAESKDFQDELSFLQSYSAMYQQNPKAKVHAVDAEGNETGEELTIEDFINRLNTPVEDAATGQSLTPIQRAAMTEQYRMSVSADVGNHVKIMDAEGNVRPAELTKEQVTLLASFGAGSDVNDSTLIALPKGIEEFRKAGLYDEATWSEEAPYVTIGKFKELWYDRSKTSRNEVISTFEQIEQYLLKWQTMPMQEESADLTKYASMYALYNYMVKNDPYCNLWHGIGDSIMVVVNATKDVILGGSTLIGTSAGLLMDGVYNLGSAVYERVNDYSEEQKESLKRENNETFAAQAYNQLTAAHNTLNRLADVDWSQGFDTGVAQAYTLRESSFTFNDVADAAEAIVEGIENLAIMISAGNALAKLATAPLKAGAAATNVTNIVSNAISGVEGVSGAAASQALTLSTVAGIEGAQIGAGVKTLTALLGANGSANLLGVISGFLSNGVVNFGLSTLAESVGEALFQNPQEMARILANQALTNDANALLWENYAINTLYEVDQRQAVLDAINAQPEDRDWDDLWNETYWGNVIGGVAGIGAARGLLKLGQTTFGKAATAVVRKNIYKLQANIGDSLDALRLHLKGYEDVYEWMENIKDPTKKDVFELKRILREKKRQIAEEGASFFGKNKDEILEELSRIQDNVDELLSLENAIDDLKRGGTLQIMEWTNSADNPSFAAADKNIRKLTGQLMEAEQAAGFKSAARTSAGALFSKETTEYIGASVRVPILQQALEAGNKNAKAIQEEIEYWTERLVAYQTNATDEMLELADQYVNAYKNWWNEATNLWVREGLIDSGDIARMRINGIWGENGELYARLQRQKEMSDYVIKRRDGRLDQKTVENLGHYNWGSKDEFVDPTLVMQDELRRQANAKLRQQIVKDFYGADGVPTVATAEQVRLAKQAKPYLKSYNKESSQVMKKITDEMETEGVFNEMVQKSQVSAMERQASRGLSTAQRKYVEAPITQSDAQVALFNMTDDEVDSLYTSVFERSHTESWQAAQLRRQDMIEQLTSPSRQDSPKMLANKELNGKTAEEQSEIIKRWIGEANADTTIPSGGKDSAVSVLNRKLGTDNSPKIIPDDEFMATTTEDRMLYKGTSSPEDAARFRQPGGYYYTSGNTYGNGIYFTSDKAGFLGSYAAKDSKSDIIARLSPDAKIISSADVSDLNDELFDWLNATIGYKDALPLTARLYGYDVIIHYPGSSIDDSTEFYYTVLNKGAVEVRESAYKPRSLDKASLTDIEPISGGKLDFSLDVDSLADNPRALLAMTPGVENNEIMQSYVKAQRELEFKQTEAYIASQVTSELKGIASEDLNKAVTEVLADYKATYLQQGDIAKVADEVAMRYGGNYPEVVKNYLYADSLRANKHTIREKVKAAAQRYYENYEVEVDGKKTKPFAKGAKGRAEDMAKRVDAAIDAEFNSARAEVSRLESAKAIVDNTSWQKEVYAEAKKIADLEDVQNVIAIQNADGATELVEVDPLLADFVTTKPAGRDMGAFGKINYLWMKLFRMGTTGINPSSMVNQEFRDLGNAWIMGNVAGTISTNQEVLAEIFGENPARFLAYYSDEAQESFAKIAQEQGRSIEEVIAEAEIGTAGRAGRVASASTETESLRLYRETRDMWYKGGVADVTAFDKMGNAIDKFTERVGFINEKREKYLRNLVYANNYNTAIKNGRSIESARIYAEFMANNATTNFTRATGFMSNLQNSIPYLRAAINGTKSFWRLWSLDPVGVTGRILGGLGIPIIGLTTMSLSSEENRKAYNNIKEYQKEIALPVVMNGEAFMIPLPQELAPFVNPIRQAVEETFGLGTGAGLELVVNDLIDLSPIDFGGFVDLDSWRLYGTGTDWGERLSQGSAQLFSQIMPKWAVAIATAASGRDLYTGKEIDTSYTTVNPDTGEIEVISYTSGALANKIHELFPNLSAPVAQEMLENIFGVAGNGILDFLVEAGNAVYTGATTGDFGAAFMNAAETTVEGLAYSIRKPVRPYISDAVQKEWRAQISALWEEKKAILAGDAWQAYIKLANNASTPEQIQAAANARANIIDPFYEKVKNVITGLIEGSGMDYTPAKYASVLSLMNMHISTATGNAAIKQANNDAYQEAKRAAIATMARIGFPSTSIASSAIGQAVVSGTTGETYIRYGTPLQILDMEQTYYGQSSIHQAEIEQLLSANGIYRSNMFEGYNAAKTKAEKKQAKAQWNARVINALAPYVQRYGATAVINNQETVDLLSRYIFVDNPYNAKSYLRAVFKGEE